TGTTAGAIGCLDYVAMMKDRGVNIVATNNSWGGGDFSRGLFDAIAAHQQRGILFVAAARQLQAAGNVVRAVHVSELRAAIDNLRARTGLVRFDWIDATLVPGSTVVRRAHVEELRSALIAVYEVVGRPAPSFSDSTIIGGVTVIRASQLEELRSAARALD
ncbi:MAG: hypothetical protein DME04_04125, partial [Candidatus Rokuibacteriota bacterium]